MRVFKGSIVLGVAAFPMVLLTGCTVADAASPESKNTPVPAATQSPLPTASSTPTPVVNEDREFQPTPTEDTLPKARSDGDFNGGWCSWNGQLCFTVEHGTYEQMGELYVIQGTGDSLGCLQGTVTHHTYEGMHIMYCPAGTPTPFTLINPDATSAEEAVYMDDASRDRLWLYNGVGPATYFKQP